MERQLKKVQLKNTPQRRALLEALRQAGKPISAEELFALLPRGMSLSTVYRNLGVLTDRGMLIKTVGRDGVATYQPNTQAHCHRIICSVCGSQREIRVCPLEELSHRISQDTGYKVTGHSLEFIGVCPQCRKSVEEKNTT